MKKPLEAGKFFLDAASFVPLILFQVWISSSHAPRNMAVAAVAMLFCCLLIVVAAFRRDRPGYFDWAVTGYFAAISGALLFWPDDAAGLLRRYGVTGIYICLFIAAACPPLLGMEPFTVRYAGKTAPPDVWENPIFLKINGIMTYTWAGFFAVCMVLTLHPSVLMKVVLPNLLVLGIGFPFNSLFPDFYLKRLGIPSRSEREHGAREDMTENPAVFEGRSRLRFAAEATLRISASPPERREP
jgi:hypothetical protein